MKVAIYIRVSTEEQAKEGYSISAQKQRLKAFCIAQDWQVVDLYVDEGISAKDMNRPELQRMITDIKEGKIDCVLVYRLDRLTRSVLDLYKMLQTFDKHDCKFKSVTEVFETTTAMGRMFITMVAAMAQWERENLGERVKMGMAEKVRQGKYANNIRPMGYDLDHSKGTLTIKEDEAKTIRLIVDLYLKGLGASRICQYLNERNILTKSGNLWTDNPLMKILKNPIYTGTIRWGDELTENAVPPIIDQASFEMVQTTIDNRRGLSPKQVASTYIFSGVIKCRNCGRSMVGGGSHRVSAKGEKKVYRYYRCHHLASGICTQSGAFSETRIEKALVEHLQLFDFPFDEVAATGEHEINEKKDEDQQADLKKELEKLESRKKKWQYAWANDKLSDEDFDKRMSEERSLEEEIKAQIIEAPVEEIPVDKSELYAILKNIGDNWYKLTKEEKKNFVQRFIKEMKVVYEDKKRIGIDTIDFF
ncbi:MAG: hypothetical protein K0S25_43 [Bacillus sp. (in: firmicutes)]|jgi:site-specific DNA recombinase|nr:hypothetical protein [Bacillus sp. (in: firmicutes)]